MGFSAIVALAALGRGWPIASYAILTAGAAFKIVPVLLVPVFVLAAATQSQRSRRHSGDTVLMQPRSSSPGRCLVYISFGGGVAQASFQSPHRTGLELGSAYSVPVLLADSCEVRYEYGGYALRGSLADRVARSFAAIAAIPLVLAVLVAGHASAARRYGSSHADRQRVRPGVVIVHPDRESGVAADLLWVLRLCRYCRFETSGTIGPRASSSRLAF